ncbi:MAG TPA: transglycosylase SLT domain-containing protein [Pyrinomonadaceae bacterium]
MNKSVITIVVGLVALNLAWGALVSSKAQRSRAMPASRLRSHQANLEANIVKARGGDSLSSVAARAGVPVEDLARINGLSTRSKLRKGQELLLPPSPKRETSDNQRKVESYRIVLVDGSSIQVDEAWREGKEVWYRRGGIRKSLDREVRAIEPVLTPAAPAPRIAASNAPTPEKPSSVRIYLVGGAEFKVDEIREGPTGIWYNRRILSVFLERERIARIERVIEGPGLTGETNRDWTSGDPRIDELIRTNGNRYGIDPYLVFCVIEHESHFHTRALSPKGAQGLMQLMPGTARRFGVRRPYDVAENIKGGTQYLKELMDMFGGQVNLVLASYNAGEGAVLKYGRNVPPYRETREYVKRISKRYGINGRQPNSDNDLPSPQQ